ncbi:C-_U-editing enzyme APOBEC-2 [Manacus vitellinus]|uniref:C->U-editing enzyme APOBEC-2 n=1 Tax=Manacus vitellinus TaxID=328815 RepID=UPI00115CB60A|nr:C->U-editing enzyme APOBEC-2 [Manacus vitellinus]
MAEKQEEPSNAQNGEPDNAEEGEGKKKKVKREDLPPFEIVTGWRMKVSTFTFPPPQAGGRCTVTWYVSSSPCVSCAQRIADTLRGNRALRLTIMVGRLFMWDEPEVQAALRSMKEAGCKLRIMKPQDFEYVWQNFVEQEEGEEVKSFVPWEDIQENFQYYEEKLAEILH